MIFCGVGNSSHSLSTVTHTVVNKEKKLEKTFLTVTPSILRFIEIILGATVSELLFSLLF